MEKIQQIIDKRFYLPDMTNNNSGNEGAKTVEPLKPNEPSNEVEKGREAVRSTLGESDSDVDSAFTLFVEKGPNQPKNEATSYERDIGEAFDSIRVFISNGQIERGVERLIMLLKNRPQKATAISNKIGQMLEDLNKTGHSKIAADIAKRLATAGYALAIKMP